MALDIILVRHGESEMQRQPHLICGRCPSTPLTERGREQALRAGERLMREKRRFHEIHVSPTIRTYQTLDFIKAALVSEAETIVTDALHEIGRGTWDGLDRESQLSAHPEIQERVKRHGVDFCIPGGESMREVGARMFAWANEQATIHEGRNRTILAISHCVAINCLVWALFGFDDEFALHPKIQNASLTHIRHSKKWRLLNIGDHAHLPDEELVEAQL